MERKSLVWIDCEMTGLDASHDVILEMAIVITNDQLEEYALPFEVVIAHGEDVLSRMDPLVHEMHTRSGLIERVRASNISLQQAAEDAVALVKEHVKYKKGLLAGNSVWKDREFLVHYLPELIKYLDYRVIDVSTLKELIKSWYPERREALFTKSERHRALDDVKESLAELRHFRKSFFV